MISSAGQAKFLEVMGAPCWQWGSGTDENCETTEGFSETSPGVRCGVTLERLSVARVF